MKLIEVSFQLKLVMIGVLVVGMCSLTTAESPTRELRHRHGCKREAYVTLLYGDGDYDLLPVRVLGLSLKLSCTRHEMVVLCTENVSAESRRILESDGWTVKTIATPYANYPKQFSKFLIWTLTEYRRIVFMDSDTLVYANIDELFRCGKFCAAYQHSDLFNSGVLVVKPDLQEYRNLITKIGIYPSNAISDEEVLNYYYRRLTFAQMFNTSNPHYQEEPMRLPAVYNADIGQYYLYTSRFFPLERYKVLHHTLGPVKPWKWWAYPIFDLNRRWVELRDNLHPSSDSTMGLFFAAAINLLLLMIQIVLKYHNIPKPTQIAILNCELQGSLLRIIITLLFPVSCVFGFLVVPELMHPHYAIPTFSLWTIFFLRLFYYSVFLVTSTSQTHYEFPMSKNIVLIGILLFMPFALPLYIQSFFVRVCAFLTLSTLSFVCCHLIVSRCCVKLMIIDEDG